MVCPVRCGGFGWFGWEVRRLEAGGKTKKAAGSEPGGLGEVTSTSGYVDLGARCRAAALGPHRRDGENAVECGDRGRCAGGVGLACHIGPGSGPMGGGAADRDHRNDPARPDRSRHRSARGWAGGPSGACSSVCGSSGVLLARRSVLLGRGRAAPKRHSEDYTTTPRPVAVKEVSRLSGDHVRGRRHLVDDEDRPGHLRRAATTALEHHDRAVFDQLAAPHARRPRHAPGRRRGTPRAGRTSSRSPWHGRCRSRRRRRTGGSASRCRRSSARSSCPERLVVEHVESPVQVGQVARQVVERRLVAPSPATTCRSVVERRLGTTRATRVESQPGTAVWRLAALISVMSAPRRLDPASEPPKIDVAWSTLSVTSGIGGVLSGVLPPVQSAGSSRPRAFPTLAPTAARP